MKTVFSILIVCFCATDLLAFAPQEFAGQIEHATVESQVPQASTRCRCSGIFGGGVHSGGITLQDMWDREHPDGTQHGHIAYPSNGMYYYRRPYNASHYRQHRIRLQQVLEVTESIGPQFNNGFQYVNPKENHLFRSQVRSADPKKDRVDPPTDSGVLEFADWRRYKAANMAWTKEMEEKQLEEGTPARLSSHAK